MAGVAIDVTTIKESIERLAIEVYWHKDMFLISQQDRSLRMILTNTESQKCTPRA